MSDSSSESEIETYGSGLSDRMLLILAVVAHIDDNSELMRLVLMAMLEKSRSRVDSDDDTNNDEEEEQVVNVQRKRAVVPPKATTSHAHNRLSGGNAQPHTSTTALQGPKQKLVLQSTSTDLSNQKPVTLVTGRSSMHPATQRPNLNGSSSSTTNSQHHESMKARGRDAGGGKKSNPSVGKPSAAVGSRKRLSPEDGEGESKKGCKIRKKDKDKHSASESRESHTEEVFDMIEIEEPIIKQENLRADGFSGLKTEGDISGTSDVNVRFETVYCATGIVKEEPPDYIETISNDENPLHSTDADILVPSVVHKVIKPEPLEEDEGEDNDSLESVELDDPLMWRCPLVVCSEKFRNEMEMYQHLKLSHAIKDLSLSSKSKTTSGQRGASDTPSLLEPYAMTSSPMIGTSSRTGMMSFTQSSLQSFPVTVASISTPVTTCQPVSSSSSGPVTVTTTYSYSSIPLSSTSFVTAVSSPSLPSASKTRFLLLTTPVLASSPQPSSSSQSSILSATDQCKALTLHRTESHGTCATALHGYTTSQSSLPAALASQEPTKLLIAPINSQGSDSTSAKTFSPLPPQPTQTTAVKSPQPQYLQIYQHSEIPEDLQPCAIDDTEMFAISLSRFPASKRAPIKRKLLDVVDCIGKKNVSPDKLVIAYYSNVPESRSV